MPPQHREWAWREVKQVRERWIDGWGVTKEEKRK
jgi:hypothetical protein